MLPKRETRIAPRRGAESAGSTSIERAKRRSGGGGSDRGYSDISGSGGGGAGVDHRHRHHRRTLREARRGIGWEESSDDEAVSVSRMCPFPILSVLTFPYYVLGAPLLKA